MSSDDTQAMLETWHARDVLYRQLFGPHLFNLPKAYQPPPVKMQSAATSADIAALLGTTISETDITIMVHEPNELRGYWTYVTAGLSNPWFGRGDGDVSGFGYELVLKTSKPGRWQIRLLRRLISYVVTYSGTLQPGVMLQFDLPLFYSSKSKMDGILMWYADEAPECLYELPTGRFGIFLVLGIMDDEADFVRSFSDGTWCMQQLLRQGGHNQITEPWRESIMSRCDAKEMIYSLRSYASLFTPTDQSQP